MNKNKFGEIVFSEDDIIDVLMSTGELPSVPLVTNVSIKTDILDEPVNTVKESDSDLLVEDFDKKNQQNWHMPDSYKQLDIAQYILGLCKTDEQLQRVAHELLLYQERDLFNLLRYLKYLVDTMEERKIIWGVGRGSSVASYVLYLLKVHRIDSIYYDLDPEEFLR